MLKKAGTVLTVLCLGGFLFYSNCQKQVEESFILPPAYSVTNSIVDASSSFNYINSVFMPQHIHNQQKIVSSPALKQVMDRCHHQAKKLPEHNVATLGNSPHLLSPVEKMAIVTFLMTYPDRDFVEDIRYTNPFRHS